MREEYQMPVKAMRKGTYVLFRRLILFVMFIVILVCNIALGQDGVTVEVIRIDGESVVLLTPDLSGVQVLSGSDILVGQPSGHLVLPQSLLQIEENAFECITAERVDVSENVALIEARAFADCIKLKEIHIPKTVVKVDDHALEGCSDVKVYGTRGTEAERFAAAAGFEFVATDLNPDEETGEGDAPAVELPVVPR